MTKQCLLTIATIGALLIGIVQAEDAPKPREPGLAGRSEVLLACDFEDAEWWRAWGAAKQPVNTAPARAIATNCSEILLVILLPP